MKFGKRLKRQVEDTLPGWRDKYLSYKDLKRFVRLISSAAAVPFDDHRARADFLFLLNDEIEKFNAFFVEQEEDFVIRHKELQQRMKRVIQRWGEKGSEPSEARYREQMGKMRKDIVDFHGEMVLLMNYSNINYTGVAKILKKYDKRTGDLLRLLYIQKVLQQPFFNTDLISKLVKEWEDTTKDVFPDSGGGRGRTDGQTEAMVAAREGIFRNTVAALLTMRDIREGSSTYGAFSLPPLSFSDSDPIHSLQLNPPIPII